MTSSNVLAVGGPPTFRPQVARALGAEAEAIQWMPSVTAAEDAVTGTKEPFDLVVLSPGVKEADAIGVAQFLGRQSPTTAVVVVRDHAVDGAFPRLVRAGIKDVVDLSRGGDDLQEALRHAAEWAKSLRSANGAEPKSAGHGRVISVFSTKGGTGKTFLATNLAAALASRSGKATALVDLDIEVGDVFAYFGSEPTRSLRELISLGEEANAETMPSLGTDLGNALTGFGSPSEPGAEPIAGEAMGGVLRAIRSAFDFTVIDATHEYTDRVLAAFDLSDDVCLITGLDVIGVRHLSLAMLTLEGLGVPRERLRVVLNRADSKVELTPADIEDALGIRVDAMIPSSPLVPRSINRARLLWFDEPRSAVAKSITTFADRIIELADASASPAHGSKHPAGRRRRRGSSR